MKNIKRQQEKFAVHKGKDHESVLLEFLSLMTADEVETHLAGIPCNCPRCTVANQPDFNELHSALEELYTAFNQQHQTENICLFLPKFHAELNPIERVWQIIKRYVRNYNDEGNLPKVRALYKEAIKEEQLPIKLIRKFIRSMYFYLFEYEQGLD